MTTTPTQSELNRIDATPLLVSIYEVLRPGTANATLAALRRIYLGLCLVIHPDRCGAENFDLATRCTQKVSRCYELEKEYAELHPPNDLMFCIIPYSLRFTWLAPTPPSSPSSRPPPQDVPSPRHSPANYADDLFDSFFPDQQFNDDSYDDSDDDSDDSVIFVSEQSSKPLSSTPVDPPEGPELTNIADRSGTSCFQAGSQKERQKAAVKNYKARAKEQAKQALEDERSGSESWTTERVCPIHPEIGQLYRFRWMCERFCRAHTAYHGIHQGVRIHQTVQQVTMTCRSSSCNALLRFNRLPSAGKWRLHRYNAHENSCAGDIFRGDSCCVAAYTAKHVARLILPDVRENPSMTTKTIATMVRTKEIYSRQPSIRHFRAVRTELAKIIAKYRLEEMASMEGYAELLRELGHTVEIFTCQAFEMRVIRVKAARFIFNQLRKSGHLPQDAQFDARVVDTSDVANRKVYYSGFVFVPSIASDFCESGRMTTSADAAHCQGCGPQSYGTTFEVVGYDATHNLVPLLFAHSVGTECEETWTIVFSKLKAVPGFDVPGRVTIVDQEKSIDTSFSNVMQHACLFLDPLHVKKNMAVYVGRERATALLKYSRAVRAPSTATVAAIKREYGEKQLVISIVLMTVNSTGHTLHCKTLS